MKWLLSALKTMTLKMLKLDINATCLIGSFADASMFTPKNVHSIRKVKLDARAVQIINHFITANQARRLWKSKFVDLGYICDRR